MLPGGVSRELLMLCEGELLQVREVLKHYQALHPDIAELDRKYRLHVEAILQMIAADLGVSAAARAAFVARYTPPIVVGIPNRRQQCSGLLLVLFFSWSSYSRWYFF